MSKKNKNGAKTNGGHITLEYIDAKFDRHMEQWRQDRRETEARIAADRKEAEERQKATEARIAADRRETAERLAADRKESEERQKATEARIAADRKEAEERQRATEERLAAERKDAEARLIAERMEARQEFNSHRRWLLANFATVVVGIATILVTIIVFVINGG